ncbi:MAG: helix-turn-helix domain-containing protein [Sedimentisphaerales bacterium]|nr:helix-turn-helix domain-containing protein [Sedimentisphaerales bacterium]
MNTENIKLTEQNQKEQLGLRDNINIIRSRAELLDEPDRTLIKMYLDKQNSFRQIALLTGVNEATISRKIKRIMSRLSNNDLWPKLKYSSRLKSPEMKYIKEHFIKGRSIRAIAKKYKISYHTVRRIINRINRPAQNKQYKVKHRSY